MGKSQEILERAQELLDDGKESLEVDIQESKTQDNKDLDSINHEVEKIKFLLFHFWDIGGLHITKSHLSLK